MARFLVYALLADSGSVAGLVPEVEASVDEDVVVWSPCICTTSRFDLTAALLKGDDAITDVAISIGREAIVGESTVFLEWHAEGRFTNAAFLNDDLLIEPSGDRIETSGAVVVVFSRGRAAHIHCFYDALGLLEQVLPSSTTR